MEDAMPSEVEVVVTDDFLEWGATLDDDTWARVVWGIDLLEQRGLTLGHPYSSAIKGSAYPLRELRIRAHGRVLRVFYVFDVKREAVVLIGGDKTGDARLYETMVPRAEGIWVQYLKEQGRLAKENKP
jgi:hypothetical protein